MLIERRLRELGLDLPAALRNPSGSSYPFRWVRLQGDRAFVSGHLPTRGDGTLGQVRGKVGELVTVAEATAAARQVALAMLGSLQRELGDLDRVLSWGRVCGMVNTAPGFTALSEVLGGFSHLILDIYGAERGAHARSAVGVAALPYDVPVEIDAEVLISC